MSDPWQFTATGLESPAINAASAVGTAVGTAVVTLSPASRGLYVGGAGNIVATMYGGNTVTFSGVPAGTILPIRVATIGTATTATQIINLF
jgi:hypothetical protein